MGSKWQCIICRLQCMQHSRIYLFYTFYQKFAIFANIIKWHCQTYTHSDSSAVYSAKCRRWRLRQWRLVTIFYTYWRTRRALLSIWICVSTVLNEISAFLRNKLNLNNRFWRSKWAIRIRAMDSLLLLSWQWLCECQSCGYDSIDLFKKYLIWWNFDTFKKKTIGYSKPRPIPELNLIICAVNLHSCK